MVRPLLFVGKPQNLFGNNIQLDLGSAALYGVTPGTQPGSAQLQFVLVKAFSLPSQALRAEDGKQKLLPPLVQLRAVNLENGALRAGPVAGLDVVAVTLHRKLETGLIHLNLGHPVSDHFIGQPPTVQADVLSGRLLHGVFGLPGHTSAAKTGNGRSFVAQQGLGHFPSPVHPAQDVLLRDAHIFKKYERKTL